MNTYVNKNGELIVTTNGKLVTLEDYNDKSLHFVANSPEFGIIEGWIAKSLDSSATLEEGQERQFTCPRDVLSGADPQRNGVPANFLWSVAIGRSTPISAELLAQLAALE